MASGVLILGKLCFAAIGIAVGARLARDLWSRGEVGLHAVALAAICVGGIGLAAIPIGQSLGDTATGTGVALGAVWPSAWRIPRSFDATCSGGAPCCASC